MRRILGQVACVVCVSVSVCQCVSGDPYLKRWYAQIPKRRGIQGAKTALSRSPSQ